MIRIRRGEDGAQGQVHGIAARADGAGRLRVEVDRLEGLQDVGIGHFGPPRGILHDAGNERGCGRRVGPGRQLHEGPEP